MNPHKMRRVADTVVRRLALPICLLAAVAVASPVCSAQPEEATLSVAQAQALVDRALANELQSAQDASHPMRYVLRKSSPRFTSSKEICETREGAVARLISVN